MVVNATSTGSWTKFRIIAPIAAITTPAIAAPEIVHAVVVPELVQPQPRSLVSWEDLIGRKALGWVAVVTLLFATGILGSLWEMGRR